MAKENSYLEQMLTEIDSTYITNDMLENYILEEMGSHMKDKSQDIYDRLEDELDARQQGGSMMDRDQTVYDGQRNYPDDKLASLVQELLDHQAKVDEQIAKEKGEREEFYETW